MENLSNSVIEKIRNCSLIDVVELTDDNKNEYPEMNIYECKCAVLNDNTDTVTKSSEQAVVSEIVVTIQRYVLGKMFADGWKSTIDYYDNGNVINFNLKDDVDKTPAYTTGEEAKSLEFNNSFKGENKLEEVFIMMINAYKQKNNCLPDFVVTNITNATMIQMSGKMKIIPVANVSNICPGAVYNVGTLDFDEDGETKQIEIYIDPLMAGCDTRLCFGRKNKSGCVKFVYDKNEFIIEQNLEKNNFGGYVLNSKCKWIVKCCNGDDNIYLTTVVNL